MRVFLLIFTAAALLLDLCGAKITPYTDEVSKVADVMDYPDIPGYGVLPFKVFQSEKDWKCTVRDGKLFIRAIRKTTLEKELDNDLLRQKLSFSYSNTSRSSIMLTVYVTGAKKKVDLVREKLTGNGVWSRIVISPHILKNTVFENSDQINEQVTADKIRVRLHLNPGAELDISSISLAAVADALDLKTTPFRKADGAGISSIHLPENPDYWHLFAARRLRKYLYLQTGTMLPLTVGKERETNAVNIGFAPDRKFPPGGRNIYSVESGKTVSICANKSSMLVHGAYELLEKSGFRFYTRFHQVIPAAKTVKFPAFSVCKTTPLTIRHFTSYGDMIAMGYSHKKLMAPAIYGRDLPHHNDIYIVPSSLFETDPGLFALGKDGKRRDPRNRREQPKCYSNPEVRKLYKQAAESYLKKFPHSEYILLATCDFHNWCQCSACRARDKEGVWTTVFMEMINDIAREVMPSYPDKKLRTYAYTYTSEPVEGLKMHPQVMVTYAFYKPYFTSDTVNDSWGNRKGWKQLEGWIKSTSPGGLSTFAYPTQFSTRYALTMPFTATCERIAYSKKHQFAGFDLCGVTPQFEGLMTYVWGKMFWDDNADIQALIKEHMEFFYGKKSAPYMVEYFNRICRHVKEKKPSQYCEFPVMGSVTPELLEELHSLLDKAISAAPEEGRERRALMHDKAVLLYTELNDWNINNSPLNGDYERFARRVAELVKIIGKKELFTNYPVAYRDVASWVKYVAGVDVKNKKHWLDPEMQKFLAAPVVKPKTLKAVSGNSIKSTDFKGAQQYPASSKSRANICIRRASSPWSRAEARFSGDDVKSITLTGMTELESVPAVISVNGKTLFSGNLSFDKGSGKWGNFKLDIPAGLLNRKSNTLVIENTCPDPAGNAPYTYGWITVWKADIKRSAK